MTDETGYGVLTDAQWEALAPLIAQCRPPHKTEHDMGVLCMAATMDWLKA